MGTLKAPGEVWYLVMSRKMNFWRSMNEGLGIISSVRFNGEFTTGIAQHALPFETDVDAVAFEGEALQLGPPLVDPERAAHVSVRGVRERHDADLDPTDFGIGDLELDLPLGDSLLDGDLPVDFKLALTRLGNGAEERDLLQSHAPALQAPPPVSPEVGIAADLAAADGAAVGELDLAGQQGEHLQPDPDVTQLKEGTFLEESSTASALAPMGNLFAKPVRSTV